jgi:hypothetical protein
MLVSLVGDMSFYASLYVPREEREEFERRLTEFVLAGLRQHLTGHVSLEELQTGVDPRFGR